MKKGSKITKKWIPEPEIGLPPVVVRKKKTNHRDYLNGEPIPVHKNECTETAQRKGDRISLEYCAYCKNETPHKDLQCIFCGNAMLIVKGEIWKKNI